MREVNIERYLRNRVSEIGGKALKFSSPGNNGVPDRIVLLPQKIVKFVELKKPGEDLRPIQKSRKREFEKLGHKVWVIDSKEKVDDFIEICTACISGNS